MISLLDVNVLIALFDPLHVHHEAAHRWFEANRRSGWATCPLTENGLVRILSSPSYPGRRTSLADARNRLRLFRSERDHVFWTEDISICEDGLLNPAHIAGSRQLTDAYLLALAARRGGRLATFDREIPRRAAPGAKAEHLHVVTG